MESNQNNQSLDYLKDYGGSDSENEESNKGNKSSKPFIAVDKIVIDELQDNMNNNREVERNSEASSSASEKNTDLGNVLEGESAEEREKMEELVRKNNIINASAHGPSVSIASFMRGLRSDCNERQMIIQEDSDDLMEYHVSEYRDDSASDDEDSSDSDLESVKELECLSDSDDDEEGAAAVPVPNNKKTIVKIKGELGLEDLPPIEDLTISVPEQQCSEVGKICNIVDQMVVIQSLPNIPSLNIDTVLFLEKGAKPLGQIFDVFGQVTEPYYCVRFNSSEHVKEKGIETGMTVYCAPKTDHTKYIFISELMKMKGSDASWINDEEPPPQFLDYSDDETERKAKKDRRDQKKTDSDITEKPVDKKAPVTNARKSRQNYHSANAPVHTGSYNPFRPNTQSVLPSGSWCPARPPGYIHRPSPPVFQSPAIPQFNRPPPGFDNTLPPLLPHPAFGGAPYFSPPARFMPVNRAPDPYFGCPPPPPFFGNISRSTDPRQRHNNTWDWGNST